MPEGAKLKKSLFKDFAKAAEKREETPAQVFSCEIFRNFFLEHLQATVSEIFLYDVNGELHGKVATVLNLAKMTSQRTGKNSQARVTFDLEKDYDVWGFLKALFLERQKIKPNILLGKTGFSTPLTARSFC